jgi:hypothetical protein
LPSAAPRQIATVAANIVSGSRSIGLFMVFLPAYLYRF